MGFTFDRTSSEKLIEDLKKENIFKKLVNDKDVFMALRKDEIDFYYSGAKLLGYTNEGFISHKKYCFNADYDKDYIVLNKIEEIKPIVNMEKNLKFIKENAKKFAGVEGSGVGELYKFGVFHSDNRYILLDVEIFVNEKDRVDILLFDKEEKELKFVEAKHFSNSEIWAEKKKKPQVVEQIERYNKAINDKKKEILEEYRRYVEILNSYFNLNLPLPEKIYEKTKLLIFGFDSYQLEKINELLKNDGSLDGIEFYTIGNIKNADIGTIYNKKG
jgi:hypothetical protein